MPRSDRRSGVHFINGDIERSTTFSKQRDGFFKSACDLSALTGARVAVILEKDSGKMHSFGMPSAEPIADAFLSGGPPIGPFVDEATNARIELMQTEVARLDMDNAMDHKKAEFSLQRIKQIQDENPGMISNYIFSKEEDISLEGRNKLFNELLRAREATRRRLPPLRSGSEPQNGGPSLPGNRLAPRGRSWGPSKTLISSQQPSSSHCILPQVLPSIQMSSTPRDTMESHFPTQVSQMFQSTP